MTEGSNGQLPLSGYLVIETGSVIAAAFCSQLLADFGATVIKLEAPVGRAVDSLREWGMQYKDGEGFLSSILNRNKKLATLDITTPDGARLFAEWLKRADVWVENFKPGTVASWGFDDARLKGLNERLIHVAISGFGQTGPMSKLAAFGVVAEAMGGLRALTGFEDRPPVRAGVSIGDFLTGLYSAFGIAIALIERSRSNKGQSIDIAIYEAVLGVMEDLLPTYQIFNTIRKPVGTSFARRAPANIYPTRDGGWVLISAGTDSQWRDLVELFGMPEIANDSRFSSRSKRGDYGPEIDEIVSTWTRKHDAEEILALLRSKNVPVGKVNTAADILSDPHIQAREVVAYVPDERVGTLAMQGVIPKFSRTPGRIAQSGGRIGRDTEEVYRSVLGLSSEEVAALQKSRVI
jgi:crotonobetainyl-CoA:carnitine CoA-transferase CaiB-like acyl-CoA transferase